MRIFWIRSVYQWGLGMTAATDAPSKTVDRSFLRFADLTDHRVIVLHTGEQANRDANVRATAYSGEVEQPFRPT